MLIESSQFIELIIILLLTINYQKVKLSGARLLSLYLLPSTLLHELCHLITASVTGGKPNKISIIPEVTEHRDKKGRTFRTWQLGSVEFTPTTASAFPTAMAPLALLPLSYYVYSINIPLDSIDSILYVIGKSYLTFIFLNGAIPSEQDLKVALKYIWSTAIYAIVIAIIVALWPLIVNLSNSILNIFSISI